MTLSWRSSQIPKAELEILALTHCMQLMARTALLAAEPCIRGVLLPPLC